MAGVKGAKARVPAVKPLSKDERGKPSHVIRLVDDMYDYAGEVAEEKGLATVTDAVDYLLRYAKARRDTLARNEKAKAKAERKAKGRSKAAQAEA